MEFTIDEDGGCALIKEGLLSIYPMRGVIDVDGAVMVHLTFAAAAAPLVLADKVRGGARTRLGSPIYAPLVCVCVGVGVCVCMCGCGVWVCVCLCVRSASRCRWPAWKTVNGR